jgi:hypothetical protein
MTANDLVNLQSWIAVIAMTLAEEAGVMVVIGIKTETGNEIATGSVTVNRRTRDLATIGSELIQRKGSVTVEEVIGLNLLVAIVTGWKRKASP